MEEIYGGKKEVRGRYSKLARLMLMFPTGKWGRRLTDPNLKYFNLTMDANNVETVQAVGMIVPLDSRTACFDELHYITNAVLSAVLESWYFAPIAAVKTWDVLVVDRDSIFMETRG